MVSVFQFGSGEASLTVEWMQENGSMADNFTVSLSVGMPVTTSELMVTTEVPYNQNLTGRVVATNCVGSNSSALFEGAVQAITLKHFAYHISSKNLAENN